MLVTRRLPGRRNACVEPVYGSPLSQVLEKTLEEGGRSPSGAFSGEALLLPQSFADPTVSSGSSLEKFSGRVILKNFCCRLFDTLGRRPSVSFARVHLCSPPLLKATTRNLPPDDDPSRFSKTKTPLDGPAISDTPP